MRPYLTFSFFTLILLTPSMIWGPGAFDSAPYNYVWTKQFGEAFGRGEIYPHWLPNSFEGLGSPTFYFYPPLAFAVSANWRFLPAGNRGRPAQRAEPATAADESPVAEADAIRT